MKKSDIKESLKTHAQAAIENQKEVKKFEVLNQHLPCASLATLTQAQILRNVNLYTREKAFELRLPNGPFCVSYTENGAHMLLANRKGYVAAYNNQSLEIDFEAETQERLYDACWLHNELLFAAAQESAVFIYNNDGSELHTVRQVSSPRQLHFLPYHFLLASATANARLKYLDVSVGEVVSDLFITDKQPTAITANPTNGVIHLGSLKGTVTLWAPSQAEYLMKIKAHTAGVTGIAIERSGNRMVTTGLDRKVQVFDIRQAFKPLKMIPLRSTPQLAALSARNMLAISHGSKIAIMKEFEDLYLTHRVSGDVSSLSFCPFEDILTIGHSNGVSNMVVPGCGDPTYDSLEATPFMTKKQRQELEVKRLLEKIPFDMIAQESPLTNVAEKVITRPRVTDRYFNGDRAEKKALSRFKK